MTLIGVASLRPEETVPLPWSEINEMLAPGSKADVFKVAALARTSNLPETLEWRLVGHADTKVLASLAGATKREGIQRALFEKRNLSWAIAYCLAANNILPHDLYEQFVREDMPPWPILTIVFFNSASSLELKREILARVKATKDNFGLKPYEVEAMEKWLAERA